MASQLFPIIASPDIERSLSFYRDLLGGVVTFAFPGEDGTPAYVGVDLGPSHLGIGLAAGPVTTGDAVSLWIYVDDCDAVVERLRAAGTEVVEDPVDQP